MSTVYALMLDEARRGLDRQLDDFGRLRDRMVALIGVGGTLVSILGGVAVREDSPVTAWTWGALGSFVLLAALTIYVLWPRTSHANHDPIAIEKATEAANGDSDAVVRHVALQTGEQYDRNRAAYTRLVGAFCLGTLVFVAEILCLIVDLRGRA